MSAVFDEWKKFIGLETSSNLVPSGKIDKKETPYNIRKINSVLPEELYEKINNHIPSMKYSLEWSKGTDGDPYGHLNSNFMHFDFASNLADKSNYFNNVAAKETWDWIKNNIPEFKDKIILRCYVNAHVYGIEGYFHRDSKRNNEKTMVIYMMENDWDKNWAGETVFADENDEIIESVLPKKNRAVVFDSNVQHCARSISRMCTAVRKTFVIKARERRSDNFEKLSSFLVEHKAHTIAHVKGSLHDHLVRCYQTLENKGAPAEVCFAAGLHSIFGTNEFKAGIFELKDRDIIVSEFGEKAFELAAIFSIIERPNSIENPEGFEENKYHVKMNNGNIVGIDQETMENLFLIEGANLSDQDQLDSEKYPKIHNFFTRYGQNV